MERYKKTFIFWMACSLAFIWVFATPALAQSFRLDVEVRDGIYRALDGLAGHPEVIGLEDVDIEELKIGEPIPVYVVTNEGLVRQGEEWPLFYGGSIRLTAVQVPTGYQLYTYVADAVRESGLDKVAIIYDDEAFRLFDGESLFFVAEYLQDDTRKPLSSVALSTLQSMCDTATIDDAQALGYVAPPQTDSYSNSYAVYDSITHVKQYYRKDGTYIGPNKLCWAATCACIYNYVHGTDKDVIETRDYYDECYSTSVGLGGRNLSQVQDFMTNHGNVGTYTVYTSLNESITYLNLYYDRPLVGGFVKNGTLIGHMVTIYGIDTISDEVYIDDPATGSLQVSYSPTSIYFYSEGTLYQYAANIRRW